MQPSIGEDERRQIRERVPAQTWLLNWIHDHGLWLRLSVDNKNYVGIGNVRKLLLHWWPPSPRIPAFTSRASPIMIISFPAIYKWSLNEIDLKVEDELSSIDHPITSTYILTSACSSFKLICAEFVITFPFGLKRIQKVEKTERPNYLSYRVLAALFKCYAHKTIR